MKRIAVIAPGRGSYTADELGYLDRFPDGITDFVDQFDEQRIQLKQKPLRELDRAEKFKRSLHTKGENASGLIYAGAYADYQMIDREQFEIVAIAGNSMGWYITLSCAGAVAGLDGFRLVNTMGSMMSGGNIGGQVIYPVMNEDWQIESDRMTELDEVIQRINLSGNGRVFDSIFLGGNRVLGADEAGIKTLLAELPKVTLGRIKYPFQLMNHAAFHTPLLDGVVARAYESLPSEMFQRPTVDMIDGRGHIWKPYSTDTSQLREYTLNHQVVKPYDFSKSVEVILKEYNPDHMVLLGPGHNLGGSIAQVLIRVGWKGIRSKTDFINMQKEQPFLLSMGRADERMMLMRR